MPSLAEFPSCPPDFRHMIRNAETKLNLPPGVDMDAYARAQKLFNAYMLDATIFSPSLFKWLDNFLNAPKPRDKNGDRPSPGKRKSLRH